MKKIMFKDKFELTDAILSEEKIMARSICKYNKPDESYDIVFPIFEPEDYDNNGNIMSKLDHAFGWKNKEGDFIGWNIPKYKIGEIVSVAQNCVICGNMPDCESEEGVCPIIPKRSGYFNKMVVRADLKHYLFRITNIKIELLQNISDDECLKGVVIKDVVGSEGTYSIDTYYIPNMPLKLYCTPRKTFASIIDKVLCEGTWESNPYVFVYEFKLLG